MKFPVETIRTFGEAVSVKAGMSPENAKIFIDNMINADLRNVRSHGITKFRGYLSPSLIHISSASCVPISLV